MSLHSWQVILIKMLPDPCNTEQILNRQVRGLTDAERSSLTSMRGSQGLEVTRDVLQWWRLARLQVAIPFSMHLIKRLGMAELLGRYELQPCKTLFFVREAQQFQQFLSRTPFVPTLLLDMVRFECALHQARLQQSRNEFSSTQPYCETLSLSYNPELCILSLLNEDPLPDPERGRVTVEVCSELTELWRVI